LSAKTGSVLWQKTLADYKDGYFFTMAPLAADGKIIVGSSGPGEMGNRGFIAALDADSGTELWRTYTIPAAGEPGNDTWAGESWKHGGGAVWLTGTYDPGQKTAFFGVGNPAPWDANLRKGKNLYTNSVLALDIKNGSIKWFRQYHPNDTWDLDTPHEHLLITLSRGSCSCPAWSSATSTRSRRRSSTSAARSTSAPTSPHTRPKRTRASSVPSTRPARRRCGNGGRARHCRPAAPSPPPEASSSSGPRTAGWSALTRPTASKFGNSI